MPEGQVIKSEPPKESPAESRLLALLEKKSDKSFKIYQNACYRRDARNPW